MTNCAVGITGFAREGARETGETECVENEDGGECMGTGECLRQGFCVCASVWQVRVRHCFNGLARR